MAAFDGSIRIDTRIDEKGFNRGISRMSTKIGILAAAIRSMGQVLPLVIKKPFQDSLAFFRGFGATLKKVFLGGLLLLAVSLTQIFRSIRESVGDILTLRGAETIKQVDEIKNSFEELKASIAAAFLPLVIAAIPYIKLALSWLIELFNRVAMITAALLGQKEVLQVIVGSAQKIADANKKSEKAARGQLAAFDQINVLQKPEATDTSQLPKVATEIVPITDEILSKVSAIKQEIAEWFADPIGKLKETWGKIVEWFRKNVFDPIARWWENTWLNKNIVEPIARWFSDLWAKIKAGAEEAWHRITVGWNQLVLIVMTVWSVVGPFFANSLNTIWQLFKNAFDTVVSIVTTRITAIVELINSIKMIFQGVIQFLHGVFTGDWRLAWEGITNIFTGIVNGWKAIFRGVFNTIIDLINGAVKAISVGLNSIINAMNIVSSFSGLPVIPTVSVPRIPHLATGAVIPPNSQFLAVLGDQRSGMNIEAPADLIRQIVREETGRMQADIRIEFGGSLGELVRQLKPFIDRENIRVGSNLIRSGVTK